MCKTVCMKPVDRIIQKFGGLSKMAKALGHEYPTTVQGWRDRGTIPAKHIPTLIEVAAAHGIELSYADFFDAQAAE